MEIVVLKYIHGMRARGGSGRLGLGLGLGAVYVYQLVKYKINPDRYLKLFLCVFHGLIILIFW